MQLTASETADLMGVSEKTIYRWVKNSRLPAFRINGQYRFNRAEVLEWATSHRVNLPDTVFCDPTEQGAKSLGLAQALRAGGIHYRVEGTDKASVLKATVDVMPLPEGVDKAFLLSVLMARETMGSTGIGDGIAIPHARNPIVLHVSRPMIALCFLDRAIEFGALDGKPVHTVFAIVSPTTAAHLGLLSRLAFALRQPAFMDVLARQGTREEIISSAARIDESVSRRVMDSAAKGDAET